MSQAASEKREAPLRRATVRRGPGRRTWRHWVMTKSPVFGFGLRFTALLAVFYLVGALPIGQRFLQAYLHATASVANELVHRLGEASQVTGSSIWSAKYAVTVTNACSALGFAALFGAAVLAFPATWSRRIPGVVTGILLIALLNVIRVASLYLFGAHGSRAFVLIHEEVWPALMIMVTVMSVAGWIGWALRPAHAPADVAP